VEKQRIKVFVGDEFVDTTDPEVAHTFIDKHVSGKAKKELHAFVGGKSAQPDTAPEALKVALTFFDLLRTTDDRGVESERVSKALKVQGRGIGNRLKPVKKLLQDLGFEQKQVYARAKIPGVGNFWRRRAEFARAYEAVQRAASGG
jgi:hypothetical protein